MNQPGALVQVPGRRTYDAGATSLDDIAARRDPLSSTPTAVARRSGRLAPFLWLALLFGLLGLAFATPLASGRVLVDDEVGWSSASASQDWNEIARKIDEEILPIPQGAQTPLSWYRAQGGSAWGAFRSPFPSVPVWNPPGAKRVGLQAGHWKFDEAPDELAELRSNPGTSGGGTAEWQYTLDVAQRAADILRAAGVEVDLLPTAIPVRYRAHAFVAIHADGDGSGVLNGFKTASPSFSGTPDADSALVEAINDQYSAITGLPRMDNQISLRMRYYYAFNARRYQHAVAPGVPQAIIETGFLTNSGDRALLLGDPDRVARGVASGVLAFLAAGAQPAD